MSWDIRAEEERTFFEVVRLDDLPAVDREDIEVIPSPQPSLWLSLVRSELAGHRLSICDDLRGGDRPARRRDSQLRGEALGLEADDLGWLLSLFSPVDGIIVLRDSRQFTNGMHRTHALRMAGVDRCLVYTGRGELP